MKRRSRSVRIHSEPMISLGLGTTSSRCDTLTFPHRAIPQDLSENLSSRGPSSPLPPDHAVPRI